MLDKQTERLMQQEEKFFGISPGFKIYSPVGFGGVNQQSSRMGMADTEFYWLENFIPIGQSNLRTLWDKGAALYNAPTGKTIVYFFWFNIGPVYNCAVFLSDGTAVQVSTTGVVVTISSTPNTFYTGGQLPVCGQWGALYLLIANNITPNSYWVWDGTNLYTSGSLAPEVTITDVGSGYGSPPTITAYGGNGSGVTFSSTVNNGGVVSIQVTNPGTGYLPGDIVQLAFSGTGSANSAILTSVLVSGIVLSANIVNPGSGYTAGTYALSFSGGGGGSGAAGTYTVDSSKTVVSTLITTAGSGYTSTPTVAFPSGGGSGATAVVGLSPNGVASVTVVNGGTGFPGTPTISFVGGGGTGAAGTAVLSAGVITSITITSAGSGYTSPPAVVVETAVNLAAAATVTLMPYGISGTSLETFNSRVWLPFPHQQGIQNNGGIFNVSAPGSFTDFATSDGGDTFTSTDTFLKAQFTNIKQSNGYLYPIGDSSVSVISNVQSSGSPVQTTFNYQNTDPQIGTSWRDSVSAYSTTILFGNQFGVYGVYGGKATKISGKLDTIFNNAVFPAAGGVTPSSAIANMFSQKAFLMLMTVTDPFTFSPRNVLLGWDEKQWFIASQSNLVLTFIGTQEINSNCTAWGTDGNSLYPLFSTASANLEKTISTKLYGQQNFLIQKEAMGVYLQFQDLSKGAKGVSFNYAALDSETGSYTLPFSTVIPRCPPPYYGVISTSSGDVYGVNLGLTLRSMAPDFTMNFLGIGYIETGSIAMGSTPINGQINTE